jgi:hypothetical protein
LEIQSSTMSASFIVVCFSVACITDRTAWRGVTRFLRSRQFELTMGERPLIHYLLIFEFARKGLVCRSCTLVLFAYIYLSL